MKKALTLRLSTLVAEMRVIGVSDEAVFGKATNVDADLRHFNI